MGSVGNGAALQETIAGLSTALSGFCAQEHRGGTCRRATRNGAPYISGFVGSVIKGIWEKLLEILVGEPDFEWLMIDESHCKVHHHAVEAKGGNQDMSRTKGELMPKLAFLWMQMVCQSKYLSQRYLS